MRIALRVAAFAVALFALSAACAAMDASSAPEAKRTVLGLYLTAEETPAFLAQQHGRSLFLDVRAPEELKATGVASPVDANAPSLAPSGPDAAPRINASFVPDVEKLLATKGLTKDDADVVICRTGRRSAQAADLLAAAGFTRVYSVVDGFEGDPRTPGAKGWKGAGLPWRPAQP